MILRPEWVITEQPSLWTNNEDGRGVGILEGLSRGGYQESDLPPLPPHCVPGNLNATVRGTEGGGSSVWSRFSVCFVAG